MLFTILQANDTFEKSAGGQLFKAVWFHLSIDFDLRDYEFNKPKDNCLYGS